MIKFLKRLYRRFIKTPCCIIGKKSAVYDPTKIINSSNFPSTIKIGDYTHIKGELFIFGHGGKIEIGDYCYVGENTRIWSGISIKISDRVLISHNCNVFDNDTHPLDPAARHDQFKTIITSGHPRNINLNDRPVLIEEDVLIGANCSILKGVTIGKGSVIGTGSVITRSVPPGVIMAGNPAKIIREINKK